MKSMILDDKSCMGIKEKIDTAYGDPRPSITTIRYLVKQFQLYRTSVFDDENPDRPVDVTSAEMIESVNEIVFNDRQINVREIAEIECISYKRVIGILFFRRNKKWKYV